MDDSSIIRTQTPPDDAERRLVERARIEPRTFAPLYEANYTRILNYIYHCTLNISTAEELTSNTFYKAFRGLPRYRHKAPFYAWLYQIATNEIRMHHRSVRRKRKAEQDISENPDLERIHFDADEMEERENRAEKMLRYARLRLALDKLPEKHRRVLILRYFENLTHEETAAVLGKRTGTVKSLASRGLKRLANIIEEQSATFS